MAASAIIVYDYMITFDQEIELIWKARWSMVKYLFLVNRYYILCCVIFNNYALFTTSLTDSFCLRWFQWQGWTGLVGCMIAEIILQARIYALYLLNKKVLALMLTCFVASSTCAAVIMGRALSNITAVSELIPGMPFCIPLDVPPRFYTFWIPILAFETLLCALALGRGIQTARAERGTFRFRRDLVNILVRDSVLYFLVILATYLTNLVVWSTQSEYLIEVPIAFSVAMSCVMGNRIILNVRGMKKDLQSVDIPRLHPQDHKYVPNSPVSVDFEQGMLCEAEMWELRNMRAEAV